jgi:hypothetical protein
MQLLCPRAHVPPGAGFVRADVHLSLFHPKETPLAKFARQACGVGEVSRGESFAGFLVRKVGRCACHFKGYVTILGQSLFEAHGRCMVLFLWHNRTHGVVCRHNGKHLWKTLGWFA